VDGLKSVNDRLGHGVGDLLLQQAAKVLSTLFRAEDMVARIGGDEFIVLLPETDEAAVDSALQRIEGLLCEAEKKVDVPTVSLSLGGATTREAGTLFETIRQADERMYQVKLSRSCRERRA
jgi:diguanylate cyclase (GGDEF)-like protein